MYKVTLKGDGKVANNNLIFSGIGDTPKTALFYAVGACRMRLNSYCASRYIDTCYITLKYQGASRGIIGKLY